MRILVINCGSTTLKYKLYEAQERGLILLAAASVPMKAGDEAPIAGVLAALPAPPDAVAHRVVHGGDRFTTAVRVDSEILRHLHELTPLAPLHNGRHGRHAGACREPTPRPRRPSSSSATVR